MGKVLRNFITTFWLKEPRQIVKQNQTDGVENDEIERKDKGKEHEFRNDFRFFLFLFIFGKSEEKKSFVKLCELNPFRLTCWTQQWINLSITQSSCQCGKQRSKEINEEYEQINTNLNAKGLENPFFECSH